MLPVTIRRVLLVEHRVDFRKRFDGLLAEALRIGGQPYDGDCVVFVKKDRTQLRVLVGDQFGLYLVSRRFDGGAAGEVAPVHRAAEREDGLDGGAVAAARGLELHGTQAGQGLAAELADRDVEGVSIRTDRRAQQRLECMSGPPGGRWAARVLRRHPPHDGGWRTPSPMHTGAQLIAAIAQTDRRAARGPSRSLTEELA